MPDSESSQLYIDGIPDRVPKAVAAVCRSRLISAVSQLFEHTDTPDILIRVGTTSAMQSDSRSNNYKSNKLSEDLSTRYQAQDPLYSFDQLILPDSIRDDLVFAVEAIRVESIVFDEWGLRKIEPFPRAALNFYGPPGTGKTLAAHALAGKLGKKIISASYAEIESKYHGDGPKNVKALFHVAESDEAVLFIDEADSLLSKRLVNVTQGSEQAINSMRSQLLVCLEQFHGVVIFSTNLAQNYDKAFETRVKNVYFPMPDEECRRKIWKQHLLPGLPLDPDVSVEIFSTSFDNVCGRDIKNAIIDAAVRAAITRQKLIASADIEDAVKRVLASRLPRKEMRPLSDEEKNEAKDAIRNKLKEKDQIE